MDRKKKITMVASPIMFIGTSMIILSDYAILIFIYVAPVVNLEDLDWFYHLFLILFAGVCPTMAIFFARRWFYIITFDEKGIKISFLGIFQTRIINWDEIKDIRYVEWGGRWLFFSKSQLDDKNYNLIIKQKDVVQIAYKEKIVKLAEYYSKEIFGLPKNST